MVQKSGSAFCNTSQHVYNMNSTHSINVPYCITDENVAVVVQDVYTVGVVVIVAVASDYNSLSVLDAFQG